MKGADPISYDQENSVRRELTSLLNDLGVTVERELQFRPGKFYFVLLGTHPAAGRVVAKIRFLDVRQLPELDRRNQYFAVERRFYERFQGASFLPGYVTSGESGQWAWLVYRYLDEKPFGNNWMTRPNLPRGVVAPTVAAYQVYVGLSPSARRQLALPQSSIDRKLADLDRARALYELSLRPYLTADELEQVAHLGKTLRPLIDARCDTLAHGDLHPENVFYLSDVGVKIIDWETAHLDLPGVDLVRLWIRSWNLAWRDDWLKTALRNFPSPQRSKIESLWRFTALAWLVGEFPFWHEVTVGRSRHEKARELAPHAQAALAAHTATFRRLLHEPILKNS